MKQSFKMKKNFQCSHHHHFLLFFAKNALHGDGFYASSVGCPDVACLDLLACQAKSSHAQRQQRRKQSGRVPSRFLGVRWRFVAKTQCSLTKGGAAIAVLHFCRPPRGCDIARPSRLDALSTPSPPSFQRHQLPQRLARRVPPRATVLLRHVLRRPHPGRAGGRPDGRAHARAHGKGDAAAHAAADAVRRSAGRSAQLLRGVRRGRRGALRPRPALSLGDQVRPRPLVRPPRASSRARSAVALTPPTRPPRSNECPEGLFCYVNVKGCDLHEMPSGRPTVSPRPTGVPTAAPTTRSPTFTYDPTPSPLDPGESAVPRGARACASRLLSLVLTRAVLVAARQMTYGPCSSAGQAGEVNAHVVPACQRVACS